MTVCSSLTSFGTHRRGRLPADALRRFVLAYLRASVESVSQRPTDASGNILDVGGHGGDHRKAERVVLASDNDVAHARIGRRHFDGGNGMHCLPFVGTYQ